MQSISGTVVAALNGINGLSDSLKDSVNNIASAIEEQTAVTADISQNMSITSTAVSEIDSNLQSIKSMVSKVISIADNSIEESRRAASVYQ